jgi:hypothetical protein
LFVGPLDLTQMQEDALPCFGLGKAKALRCGEIAARMTSLNRVCRRRIPNSRLCLKGPGRLILRGTSVQAPGPLLSARRRQGVGISSDTLHIATPRPLYSREPCQAGGPICTSRKVSCLPAGTQAERFCRDFLPALGHSVAIESELPCSLAAPLFPPLGQAVLVGARQTACEEGHEMGLASAATPAASVASACKSRD